MNTFSVHVDRVVDLLDLIRLVSVQVVEAIQGWCISCNEKNHSTFMWNGIDYLLKMPSDLDFLVKVNAFMFKNIVSLEYST